MYDRVITIVLDSVGIGAANDSENFGDIGVNTIGNISQTLGLSMPNLQKLGLGNINQIATIKPISNPLANYGKMLPAAAGKDTLAGHWEMMGVTLKKGFEQYTQQGFPQELIEKFEKLTKKKVLANKEASGMKVINEYFEEHMQTGDLIVYTSVDSTFQIAAHEDIVPIEDLYKYCEIARELTLEYNVARVIARPFKGTKENYYRTKNRKDYAIEPEQETILEKLLKNKTEVTSIGKISDIFSGKGITTSIKTSNNMDGVDQTITVLKKEINGFVFVNLVDFDSKYGHPRDVLGYKTALEEFDQRVPEILNNLKPKDLLIITADHGNDPTYKGNDHTRENVPLLVYSPNLKGNNELEDCQTFEDLGQTIAENFQSEGTGNGKSFLKELK